MTNERAKRLSELISEQKKEGEGKEKKRKEKKRKGKVTMVACVM
jgi:hypothetical protein